MLVAGGHVQNFVGLPDANLFNSLTRTWTPVGSMAYGRWYPTVTALPDGSVLVTSGTTTCEGCMAEVPELYDPVSRSWTQLCSPPYLFKGTRPSLTGAPGTVAIASTFQVTSADAARIARSR